MVTSESRFSSESIRSIREGKLSEPLNIGDFAAEENESRIFRTASDSTDFGSESMTITIFQIFELNNCCNFKIFILINLLFYTTQDLEIQAKKKCFPVIMRYLFLLKNTWIEQFLRKSDYKRV